MEEMAKRSEYGNLLAKDIKRGLRLLNEVFHLVTPRYACIRIVFQAGWLKAC